VAGIGLFECLLPSSAIITTMVISKNSVVSFHYTLNDPDGKLLDTSAGREAFAYIHGSGMIVPGLEEELEGKKSGDAMQVAIPAAKGYGVLDEKLFQRVPAEKFGEQTVHEGMQFQTPDNQVWNVVEVKDGQVLLNGNHPLAGVTLHFSLEVTDVREATKDELSHGHVHGAGGHHH